MTKQPKWACIANLGDATPWDYGGAFLMIDTTGVYDPELHIWSEPTEDNVYTRNIIVLESCTYKRFGQRKVLSDNKYHPDHPAWWYGKDSMAGMALSMGVDRLELIESFISSDPLKRAWAYQVVVDYYGPQDYPDIVRNRGQVILRQRHYLASIKRIALIGGYNVNGVFHPLLPR